MQENYIGGFDFNTKAMDTVQNMIKFGVSGDESRLDALTKGITASRTASTNQSKYEIAELQGEFLRNLEKAGVKGDVVQRLTGAGTGAPQDSFLGQLFAAIDDPDKLSNINIASTEMEEAIKQGFGGEIGSRFLQTIKSGKRSGENDKQFNERVAGELAKIYEQFGQVTQASKKEIITEAQQFSQLFKTTLQYLAESPDREDIKKQLESLGISR